MRKQIRGDAPEFLVSQPKLKQGDESQRWEIWGIAWEKTLKNKGASGWNWRQVDNEKVNHKLLPTLKTQASAHCSFCDAFPVSPPSNETIEHFRPKSKYPKLAWQWENLYFCCDFCQGKKQEHYEDDLLAPDAHDYEFDDFFWPDLTTGRIEIRPGIGSEMQKKAECTLRLYALNDPGHCTQRLATQERRSELRKRDIDDFAHRDFLQAGEKSLAGHLQGLLEFLQQLFCGLKVEIVEVNTHGLKTSFGVLA